MHSTLNITSFLKDVSKGAKLYSPLFPCNEKEQYNCEYVHYIEDEDAFTIKPIDDIEDCNEVLLHSNGELYKGGELMVFPSKDIRKWEYYNVRYVICSNSNDLDLLFYNGGKMENGTTLTYVNDSVYFITNVTNYIRFVNKNDKIGQYILSTGTELSRNRKFDKTETDDLQSGYFEDITREMWREYCNETSPFKHGDVIVRNDHGNKAMFIVEETQKINDYNISKTFLDNIVGAWTNCKDWSIELATEKEIDKWNNDVLKPKNLHYSRTKRKIIHWFNTGDAVLVRNGDNGIWSYSHFSYYLQSITNKLYVVTNGVTFKQCIPYNALTMNLVGTNGKLPREFCNWENANESLSN